MAVIGSAQELPDTGEFQFEVGKYSIRRRFRVICSDVNDDALIATSATGLPPLYSTYVAPNSSNPFMRARRYEARRLLPASKVWIVSVVYETPEIKENSGQAGGGTGQEKDNQFTDPTQELPEVDFETIEREELLTQIYDVTSGNVKPVTSSAGEPYDPPPKYMATLLRLVIERNEPISANHPTLAIQYQNAVNSDPFWGQAPGVWRCRKINAKRAVKQIVNGVNVAFLRVRYEFEGRPTWDIITLDSGKNYLRLPAAASQGNVAQAAWFAAVMPAANVDGFVPAPLPAGFALQQTRAEIRQFTDEQSHPIRGALNGQGGPLPQASTFTLNAGGFIVVPPPSDRKPGIYVNGLAVQVYNAGGALPTGATANTVYYTANVQADGSFQLVSVPGSQWVTLSCTTVSGSFQLSTSNPWASVQQVQTGWSVMGPGIAPGTTVSSVTQGTPNLIQLNLATTAALNNTPVLFQPNGGIVSLSGGTGVNTIKPLGVFFRQRPYNRLPFSYLQLPQSFNDVQ